MTVLAYEQHERTSEGLFGKIQKLIVLEMLVAHAYRAVDDLIDDPETRMQLRSFAGDHERAVRALTSCLGRLQAPSCNGHSEPQTTTEDIVGGLTPLMAMWLNEDETARGYEELIEQPIADPQLKRILARGLDDARAHWAWLTLLVQPQARYQAMA